jgi:hypothetical protein
VRTFPYRNSGKPIDLAIAGKELWLLTGEEAGRTLRQIDNDGNCMKVVPIADLPLAAAGLPDGTVAMGMYEGRERTIRKVKPATLPARDCYQSRGHVSPLVYAMNQNSIPSLDQAIRATDPWNPASQAQVGSEGALEKAEPLNAATPPFGGEAAEGSQTIDAPWHPRPIFLFPFIGAEDPLGTQYGFVSVPLMDHLQDETLRASFLYGAESHFPNTDVTLTSTRFWPTLNLTGYRSQTWDGTFWHPENKRYYSIYLDERGGKIDATFPLHFFRQSITVNLGAKSANLKQYLGPFIVREGPLNEPNASITHVRKWNQFSLVSGINGRFTLEEFNRFFDYNALGASTTATYKLDFMDSTLSGGIDASRTRGKKMRELREVYFPLRTFVPGSGGGYNQNALPLIGAGSLFSPVFGDNQLRNRVNWTFPINKDIDKWIGLAYIERLDFTAFVNYGGAWRGEFSNPGHRLFGAHGYNVDLQLENKGIRFNLGVGAGQVFEQQFQVYATTGFDALF